MKFGEKIIYCKKGVEAFDGSFLNFHNPKIIYPLREITETHKRCQWNENGLYL